MDVGRGAETLVRRPCEDREGGAPLGRPARGIGSGARLGDETNTRQAIVLSAYPKPKGW